MSGAEIQVVKLDIDVTIEDEPLHDLAVAFSIASEAVERLPDGRHKALARAHLEDAFQRAVYAAMGVQGLTPIPKRG